MRRLGLAMLLLLPALAITGEPADLVAAEAAPSFSATKEPVSATGVKSVVDLPPAQHMRNSGGNDRTRGNPRGEPGKGYGLCVFTSGEILARWLNVPEVFGWQKWMESRPGGGYPQKVDQMLAAFCKEKGVAVPPYVQHTGGDDAFLDLAVATGRGCCVTYAGFDGFYRNAAGQDVWVDHMVVLAHLDAECAAIIDNNRPGSWVWMSRKDFLVRWRARGGGWAWVFLASPPPPHLPTPLLFAAAGCGCGDGCTCGLGTCPGKCPVLFGQCANGRCVVPQTVPTLPNPFGPTYPPAGPAVVPDRMPPTAPELLPAATRQPLAAEPRPGANFVWRNVPGRGDAWIQTDGPFGWGWDGQRYGWVPKGKPAAAAEPPADLVGENYGVVRDKIHQRPTYSITGVESTEEEARAAIAGALVNDADRWHLTAVGDPAFLSRFRADVGALPEVTRAKLHVQGYAAESWPVKLFALPAGVSLRKPATARRGDQLGALAAADYSPARLSELLDLMNGPKPKPAPVPNVKPADPTRPAPDAAPATPPAQNPAASLIVLAVMATVLYLLMRGRT